MKWINRRCDLCGVEYQAPADHVEHYKGREETPGGRYCHPCERFLDFVSEERTGS